MIKADYPLPPGFYTPQVKLEKQVTETERHSDSGNIQFSAFVFVLYKMFSEYHSLIQKAIGL